MTRFIDRMLKAEEAKEKDDDEAKAEAEAGVEDEDEEGWLYLRGFRSKETRRGIGEASLHRPPPGRAIRATQEIKKALKLPL